jgi:NADH:ubiquinone reductase (non-electrogenic)
MSGVKEHAVFMKEVENGLEVQKRILHQLEHASALMSKNPSDPEIDRALHWVVVGGGPTGVELTAELSDFVNADVKKYFPHLYNRVNITLVEATDKILGTFTDEISAYAEKSLTEGGASVRCNAMVTSMTDKVVNLKEKPISFPSATATPTTTNAINTVPVYTKSEIQYGILVWAGGIAARPVTKVIAAAVGNIQLPEKGISFVRGLVVDDKFRVKGQPEFAEVATTGNECFGCV